MCSSPVTFGGGRQIVYLGFSLLASALNSPASSQRAYQPCSMACGSYAVFMSEMVLLMCMGPSAGSGGLEIRATPASAGSRGEFSRGSDLSGLAHEAGRGFALPPTLGLPLPQR